MINSNMPAYLFKAAFLFLVASMLNGCDRSRNNPGWDYFPDMAYSTAYETFSKNPNFKDGLTMRTPVAGSVPRDYSPFNYTIDPESRIRAGIELINPISRTDEALQKGEKIYSSFCIGCHGSAGSGDGQLYKSGLYPLKPRTLTGEAAEKLKDGEIFHSITLGFGSMGAHGSQIRPEERWMIVLYVRKLQEEAHAIKTGENKK